MRKKKLAWIIAIAFTLIAALIIGLLVYLAPKEPEPTPAVVIPETLSVPVDRNSTLNLYFGTQFKLPGSISRIELTVESASLVHDSGEEVPVFEGLARIIVFNGAAQLVFSEMIPNAKYESLKLSLGSAARLVGKDGSLSNVYLPKDILTIDLSSVEVPLSRTLNVLVTMPKNITFGEKNGIATLIMTEKIDSETFILGGIFYHPKSVGKIFDLPKLSLQNVIRADLGIDIYPPNTGGGSRGFESPTKQPPAN